jgi:hypothetical protein
MVCEDKTKPTKGVNKMTETSSDKDFVQLSNIQNNIESIITQLSVDGWAQDRDERTELYKEARLQILHDLKKLSSYLTVTLVALLPSTEESGSKVENYYGDDEF